MTEPIARADDDAVALQSLASYEALFVDEYPKMVALAAAVSGSRLFAEDIAQDAMQRLDRNWSKVQGYQSPGAWLRRVTINLASTQRRRFGREARARLRLGLPSSSLPPSRAEHAPVWAAVADLPRRQRAAVALRFLEDQSIAEIADVLEVAPSTARVHLHRAMKTLRERLPDFDPTGPTEPTDVPATEERPR